MNRPHRSYQQPAHRPNWRVGHEGCGGVGIGERPHPGTETILGTAKEYSLALAAPLDKSELHAGDFITGEA